MTEEKKIHKDCCVGHNDEINSDCCKDEKVESKKMEPNQVLIAILAVVVAVNILVMGYFTYSVNSKLNEAIDLTKPQEGAVTLVRVDDCPLCGDLAVYKKALGAQNVELTDDSIVGSGSAEGKELVEKYGLKKLPALIFVASDDLQSNIAKALEKDSRKVGENTIVWEKVGPPYLLTESNSISGLVDVIYLTDKRCVGCYSPLQAHRPVLQGYGVAVASEKTVDVLDTEGKELVSKYNIEQVPTMILSGAGNYEALLNVWRQVGTIEEDGVLVFRKNEVMNQTYKDLTTGKTIIPPSTPAQTQ
ncbi:MAG: hypothetical protein Q8P20_01485 [bacterium]|nr:hypothetical protein [bacterium]